MTPWNEARQAFHQLTELAQTHVDWVSDAIQPSHPVTPFSPCLQSIIPSIRVFSELALHIRWPKYWSFSFNISASNEYSGLISFRIDWFDLLEVQGTLKSLLQHHSSKASIVRHSIFIMVNSHSKTFRRFYKLPEGKDIGRVGEMGERGNLHGDGW